VPEIVESEIVESEIVIQSEPETSKSKSKVMTNSEL